MSKKLLTKKEKMKYFEKHSQMIPYTVSECIESFSYKYGRIPYSWEELYDAAEIGFLKALNGFNKNKKVKFTTFSFTCMKNEIVSHINKEKSFRALKAKAHYLSIGREDIAEKIDENNEDDEIINSYNGGYDLDENDISYEMVEIIDEGIMEDLIMFLENELSKKQFKVVKNYLGFENHFIQSKTQDEVAKENKVSQSYVSYAMRDTREKTRFFLEKYRLELEAN